MASLCRFLMTTSMYLSPEAVVTSGGRTGLFPLCHMPWSSHAECDEATILHIVCQQSVHTYSSVLPVRQPDVASLVWVKRGCSPSRCALVQKISQCWLYSHGENSCPPTGPTSPWAKIRPEKSHPTAPNTASAGSECRTALFRVHNNWNNSAPGSGCELEGMSGGQQYP